MTNAEEFLMLWAILATVFAVVFQSKARKYKLALILMQLGIKMVGEGKAKIVVEDNVVKLMEV